MRVLVIAGLFPPLGRGGSEDTALQQSLWLAARGHDVHVLTARAAAADRPVGAAHPSLRVWRTEFPRPYAVSDFERASRWLKPLWHLQDLADPRNHQIVAACLDRIAPDLALIHFLPGIGVGALSALASRDIPTIYYLHDLGLACQRMSMFRRGRRCDGLCTGCGVASKFRMARLSRIRRLGLCSPSRSTLQMLQTLLPLDSYRTAAIPNANRYPLPDPAAWAGSPAFRILYVGRIHPQKGVHIAAQAIEQLQASHRIEFRIVGAGMQERELRERYGNASWCSFAGHISQEAIAEEMRSADVLVVPSLWPENLAGTAVHALASGLPVIASRIGALPELVEDDVNGRLVEPGDVVAWADAIVDALTDPERLERWRNGARATATAFHQDALGERHLAFFRQVIGNLSHVH